MQSRAASPGRHAERSALQRYAMAVVWSAVFVAVRMGLDAVLQGQAPLIVLLAAPILAAWWGGFGCGVLATALSAVLGDMLFMNGGFALLPANQTEWLRLAIFVVYGTAFSWLIQKRFHALDLAQDEHDSLVETQRQLALREQRVSDTLEASPAGMIVVNRQGVIELVNSQAERLFGMRRNQMIGKSVDELVPESVRYSHAANRERFNANPSARAMGQGRDLWARRGDGTVFPVEIGLNPLQGTSAGMVLASVIDISSRKHAEHELALREQRVRETLEASPAGMIVVNRQGIVELVNTQAERLFQMRRDQLIGISVDALVPDNVRPGHAANRERFHANPSVRAMGHGRDLWAKRGDGTVFPVEIGLNPLKGASTGLVLASIIDISARKQAETALRDSEQRARESRQRLEADHAVMEAILKAVPAGLVLADARGRIMRSNPAHEHIWGPSPPTGSVDDYTRWKGWWADGSIRHGRPIVPQEWAMSRALRGESVTDDLVEIEPFDRPGERLTLLVTAGPVHDVHGHITGAVIAQLDVTALVKAQAAERESAEMFRSLADNIAQLAWMTDETGAIVWCNRRWYDYTGTTPEQMKGWGWQSVHHPEHVDRVMTKFRRHIITGEPWEDTFPMRGGEGQYRWFLSRAFPIRDHGGKVMSWFGTNTDITAQRQAEEALREADRRKDEFIAVLAHELRNPLAPVRSAVEILKRIGPTEPHVARTRDVIARQVTHMARLIDDLLDVSRIGRGKLALQKERCDLAQIARDTAEDYRTSLESLGMRLAVHIAPDPLWVDGDPVRLAQMLGNLLTNAGRFNNPGGHIAVYAGAELKEGMAVLQVADSGIGIDKEMMARLFDPFEQAAQDLARSRGGLGLGLALTKGLTELHGGTVQAESEGLGRGARFYLRIPMVHPAADAPPPQDFNPADIHHLRVLIVEDNHDAAATLGELLQLSGHEVELAYEGHSGLAKAHQFLPHVIISDLGLPGDIDGYELARLVRDHPQLTDVHLIAVSGYADLEARRRSAEAGYDAHLPKPPDIRGLERLLKVVVRGHATHAAGSPAVPLPASAPASDELPAPQTTEPAHDDAGA